MNHSLALLRRVLAAALLIAAASGSHAALPRFPQAYGDRIVFVANGNVWSVARSGGVAQRLTSASGQDMLPRVSPDGRWIAYTQVSRRGSDVWVIPSAGGAARRLTYFPSAADSEGRRSPDNLVVTWTPDSRHVVFMSRRDRWNDWGVQQLWRVPVDGGAPSALPIDGAVGLATFAPDGHTLAYNRTFTDFAHWKRYDGGLAPQVFTYDLETRRSEQITSGTGTHTAPMWHGRKIYFLSDEGAGRRANLWVYDQDTRQSRAVTHFTDYDIDFPALGGDAIAFQNGGRLFVLDLPAEQLREIPVTVPDDNPRSQVRVAAVGAEVRESDPSGQVNYALSPNGQRALFSARGDLFSVPATDGATRNLTATPGVDESHPAWSPDGRWIAYTTDVNGNQQIALRPAEGGPERVLTRFTAGYLYRPVFSPDGRSLSFSDSAHRLWVIGVDGTGAREVAMDPRLEIHDQTFSPDGRWLAFSMAGRSKRRHDLHLFELATGRLTRLGPGEGTDTHPVWSPDGRYLFFTSNRHANAAESSQEYDFAMVKSAGLYAVALARGTPSPTAPRPDEGPGGDTAGAAGVTGANPRDSGRVHIDLDGLMDRVVELPIAPANISQVDAGPDRIFYLDRPLELASGRGVGERAALRVYDLRTRESQAVALDVDSYSLAAKGTKVLIRRGSRYVVLDARANASDGPALVLDHMRLVIDPRKEWAGMFHNAWRLLRDLYVSPEMNGQDWTAVRDRYARLLPQVGSRADLNWLIGQVAGELGSSHMFVGGGDDGDTSPAVIPARLGVDWALDPGSGRYSLARIYPGDNSVAAYRSPLAQPGLPVKAGDYVLAINGVELQAPDTPEMLLESAVASVPMALEVADGPKGARRRLLVQPVKSETLLRQAAWIAQNRETVDRLSGGRVGYVYLANMGGLGLEQFTRQFYAQQDKLALIVDVRWNGGGSVASYLLERLRRSLVSLNTNRQGAVTTEPEDLVSGPKVVLVNHWSASNGELFPYLFRRYGLGQVVGTRTWGGLRGYQGDWTLMDGGWLTIPSRAVYNLDGTWAVENRGVAPDVEVENQPAELLAGHDRQLETAVDLMLKAIADRPSGREPSPLSRTAAVPTTGK